MITLWKNKIVVAFIAFNLASLSATAALNRYTIEEINYVLLLAPRYEKMCKDLNEEITHYKKILAKEPSDSQIELQLRVARSTQLVIHKEACALFDTYHTQLTSIKAQSQEERDDIEPLLKQLQESFAFLKSEQVDALG